ncbi:MAG: substrate-binding domain-containing protein, partial [Candidatus Limnocylindrales bacterium]
AEALERSGVAADVEELYSRLITDGRVDGLIVAFATLDDHLVSKLAERGIPLVLVNRRTAGVHGSVVVEDERGSALAVEHLVGLGHRRIGYVGLAAETDTARRREHGFRSAIQAAGLTVEAGWVVSGAPTLAGGQSAVEPVVRRSPAARPTGMFVASLLGAIGVLAGMRAGGLSVPDEMSVIAFNDHELAGHLDPPLTTVRMPNLQMGAQAVSLLLDAIDGQDQRDVVIDEPPVIVVRGSTRAI